MAFNWTDLIVVLFMLGLLFYGYRRGLLFMVYRFASFFVSIIIAWLLYPRVSELLVAFGMDQWIASLIRPDYTSVGAEQTAELPAYLQSMVQSGQIGMSEAVTAQLTHLILNIISFVCVLILARLVVWIVGHIIKVISKLPVISFFNRLGGAALGLAEGALIVYIMLALVFAIKPLQENPHITQYIDGSVLTKSMYENNPLIELVAPTDFDEYL